MKEYIITLYIKTDGDIGYIISDAVKNINNVQLTKVTSTRISDADDD